MSGLRRGFDGTGPFSGLALLAWLVGLAWFVSILMSTDGVNWWLNARSVQGRELDGLVYYSVQGSNYTVNDPQTFAGAKPRTRTVYYLSSQPGNGSLSNTGNEVLDWSLTAGPGAIGVLLLGAGFVKRYERSRRSPSDGRSDSFGNGIPEETIQQMLGRSRHPGTVQG